MAPSSPSDSSLDGRGDDRIRAPRVKQPIRRSERRPVVVREVERSPVGRRLERVDVVGRSGPGTQVCRRADTAQAAGDGVPRSAEWSRRAEFLPQHGLGALPHVRNHSEWWRGRRGLPPIDDHAKVRERWMSFEPGCGAIRSSPADFGCRQCDACGSRRGPGRCRGPCRSSVSPGTRVRRVRLRRRRFASTTVVDVVSARFVVGECGDLPGPVRATEAVRQAQASPVRRSLRPEPVPAVDRVRDHEFVIRGETRRARRRVGTRSARSRCRRARTTGHDPGDHRWRAGGTNPR